jgi:hypothetical protein
MLEWKSADPWRRHAAVLTLVLLGVALMLAPGRAAAQDDNTPPPIPAGEQPDALTSGPVNEAFAEPVNLGDQGGVIAPSQPPDPLAETAPADQPTGDDFAWIPGYWSWDTGTNTWVWVSGCWRAVPAGMAWVPGYWSQVDTGWQWVAGFWAAADAPELQYLPAPPAPIEVDAPGPPPAWDQTWVPGCWYWDTDHYTTRHGYWLQQKHGWMWSPAHLGWTPKGYVFCPGYWDLSLERRGVLFAPVAVSDSLRLRAGFEFQPSITLDLKALVAHLFVCPGYSHYYVGDYYDATWEQRGIYPRGEAASVHTCYDPVYVHATWFHHDDLAGWRQKEQQTVATLRSHPELRPARTYSEQQTRVARLPAAQRQAATMGRTLSATIKQSTVLHFEKTTPEAQKQIAQQAAAQRDYRNNRANWEAPAHGTTPTPSHTPSPAVNDHHPVTTPTNPAHTPAPAANDHHPATTPTNPAHTPQPVITEHRPPTTTPPPIRTPAPVVAPHNPPAPAPRGTARTQPETVRVPPPPVVSHPEHQPAAKPPPPTPVTEHETQARPPAPSTPPTTHQPPANPPAANPKEHGH